MLRAVAVGDLIPLPVAVERAGLADVLTGPHLNVRGLSLEALDMPLETFLGLNSGDGIRFRDDTLEIVRASGATERITLGR